MVIRGVGAKNRRPRAEKKVSDAQTKTKIPLATATTTGDNNIAIGEDAFKTGGTTTAMTIDKDGVTHFGGTDSLNDSNVVSVIPADGRISFGMDGRDSLVTGENGAYIFSGSGSSGDILAGELVIQTRSNQNRDLHFATGSTPTMRGRFRGADGDFFLGNDLGSITNLGTALRENDSGGNTYMEMGHGTTGANYSYFICRNSKVYSFQNIFIRVFVLITNIF